VQLASRSAMPAESAPWVADDRRLRVLLRGLTLRSGSEVQTSPLDHPALAEGWSQAEWHCPRALRRWTNGDAVLPLNDPGPCLLEVEVAATAPYLSSALREAAETGRQL
jgi:hypothetical protein